MSAGASAHRLFRRGSVYTVATALQLSANVLVLPFVTRILDVDEYGTVATAIVAYQLLVSVSSIGLNAVVEWDMYEQGRAGVPMARRLACSAVLIALGAACIAHVLGPFWTGVFAHVDYEGALVVAVWMVVPATLTMACQSILRAADRAGAFVACAALSALGGPLLGVALVSVGPETATRYFLGLLGGWIAAAAAGAVLVRLWPLWPAPLGRLRAALRHGGPTVPHVIGTFVLVAGDRVVVERLEGLGAVGRYQVAYLVGALGITLLLSLNNAWAPMVYATPLPRRWTVLADTTGVVHRVAGLVAAGLAIGAPFALAVAAPASYDRAEMASVSALVAGATAMQVAYLAGVHVIFSLKRTAVLAWAAPLAAVVNVGLNLVLVPRIGLDGAAVATVLAYGLLAVTIRAAARRLAAVPWDKRAGLVDVGITGAFVVLALALPVSGGALVARAVLGAGLFGAFVVSVRRLSRRPSGTPTT